MECIWDDLVTDPVECLFDVEADQLQGYAVFVGFLNKMRSKDSWFLDYSVCCPTAWVKAMH